jgi:hypothetical protein
MKSIINKIIVRFRFELNLIKGVVACGGLLLLLSAAQAQLVTNTLPFYEPFSEYNTNTLPARLGSGSAGNTTNFWIFGNSSQFFAQSSAALTYIGLQADPTNVNALGAQEVPLNSNTSGDRGEMFNTQTGTWYASFLLNYQDNGGQTEDRLAFNVVTGAAPASSFTRAYTAVWLTPDYRLQVTKNYNEANTLTTAKFSAATSVLTRNVPHLIVMRYLKVAGNNDEVDLWVDRHHLVITVQIHPQ